MGCSMMTKRDARIFFPSFLALFSSAYSLTMLFPFLPFMIEFLLPQVKEEDIGKYAGFIASSLFFGRLFGSYVWGAVSDKKGRKPVVIISCLLIGVFSAAFGFSVELYMAIIFRFMTGLFNGVVGTVKAIVSESSNNRTQALGMTLIMCSFSLGLIIGPAVSGALADPIGQYNLTISNPTVRGFLTKFPFSLPCIVNCIICVLAAVVVAVWMPETLGAKKSESQLAASSENDEEELLPQSEVVEEDDDNDNGVPVKNNTTRVETIPNRMNGPIGVDNNIADQNREVECLERGITDMGPEDHQKDDKEKGNSRPSGKRRGSLIPFFNRRSSFTPSFFKPSHSLQQSRESRHLRSLHSDRHQLIFEEEEEEEENDIELREEDNEIEEKDREGEEVERVEKSSSAVGRFGQTLKEKLMNLKLFITTRETLLSLLIYSIFSFAVIGFDEVYSLWAAAAPHLGGLGWTLHEIGISQAISGLLFLPFSFIFPVLERRFGLINVYQMSCTVTILCIVMLPSAHIIPADSLNPLRWFVVIVLVFIARVTIGSTFAAISLFINNSVVFSLLGEVNGLAQSFTSALRTISPVFAGTIFSLSLSKGARNVGFPIDYHLIFIIFGLIILCCTILAAGLPTFINRQKIVTSSSSSVSSDSINRSENSSSLLIRTTDDVDSSNTHETKL